MKFIHKIVNLDITDITLTALFKVFCKDNPYKSISNLKRNFKRMARRWLLDVQHQYVYFYSFDSETEKLDFHCYETSLKTFKTKKGIDREGL